MPNILYVKIFIICMPYKMRKVSNKNCYKVYNVKTRKVYAKCTSKSKAKKQMQLLRAIQYGFVPKKRVSP